MAMPLDAQFIDIPIFNQLVPGEGPKSIRASLDFTNVDTWIIDLTTAMQEGRIKALQSIYFDCSNMTADVVIETERSLQRIILPRGHQGYIPILLPNPAVFTAKAPLGKCTINMLNVPMPIGVWKITP